MTIGGRIWKSELSRAERINVMYEINLEGLDDERMNLNIQFSQPILMYRTYKDTISEEQADRLKDKLYRGIATCNDITRITRRLGDETGKVYGWEFPQRGWSSYKER